MRELMYREALREALDEEMARDPTVFIIGEGIAERGGSYKVTEGLLAKYGPKRVRDTPIAEAGMIGVGVGAAIAGARPVVEILYIDFAMLGMDMIVNQAAKFRLMTGGEGRVPFVLRTQGGAGGGVAAQHSQSLEAWFAHVPGLKVIQPSTPADAKGMLLAALADPDPVLMFEHKLLYKMKGEVPEGRYTTPIGRAEVVRTGRDITIVAGAIMRHRAVEAAERLAADGIEAEVIDPRSLRPLDRDTILASVRKTGRLVVVHEGVKSFGVGAEISAMVAESDAFDFLDAPIVRLGGAEAPIPYNPDLERAAVPQAGGIEAAVRAVMARAV